LKFWPTKRRNKILLTASLVILAVFGSLATVFEYSVFRETSTSLQIVNPDGAKTALLIYQPGLTSFAHDITYAFANGLTESGWRVEIATASPQAPTNISKYQLLVLCWPIYDFNPGPTITEQIHRISNLAGIDTVIVAIGGGIDPLNAPLAMDKIVQNANGTVTQTLTSFRSQHNQAVIQEKASQITP
jgi:phosphoribosylcarboxyaminoimidazole (NCAIR) mutase